MESGRRTLRKGRAGNGGSPRPESPQATRPRSRGESMGGSKVRQSIGREVDSRASAAVPSPPLPGLAAAAAAADSVAAVNSARAAAASRPPGTPRNPQMLSSSMKHRPSGSMRAPTTPKSKAEPTAQMLPHGGPSAAVTPPVQAPLPSAQPTEAAALLAAGAPGVLEEAVVTPNVPGPLWIADGEIPDTLGRKLQDNVAGELLEKLHLLLDAASRATGLQVALAEPRSSGSDAVRAADALQAAALRCASAARRAGEQSLHGLGGAALPEARQQLTDFNKVVEMVEVLAQSTEAVPIFEPRGRITPAPPASGPPAPMEQQRSMLEEQPGPSQCPGTPQWSDGALEVPTPPASIRAVRTTLATGSGPEAAAAEALAALHARELELSELREVVEDLRGRNECLELRNNELHDHTSRAAAATRQATAAGAAARKLRELQAKKLHDRIHAQEAELARLRTAVSRLESQAARHPEAPAVSAAAGAGPAVAHAAPEPAPTATTATPATSSGPASTATSSSRVGSGLSSGAPEAAFSAIPLVGTTPTLTSTTATAAAPGCSAVALPCARVEAGSAGWLPGLSLTMPDKPPSSGLSASRRTARSQSPRDRAAAPGRTVSPPGVRGGRAGSPPTPAAGALLDGLRGHPGGPGVQTSAIPEARLLQGAAPSVPCGVPDSPLSRSSRNHAALTGNWRHVVSSGAATPRTMPSGQPLVPTVVRQPSDGRCSLTRSGTPNGIAAHGAAGHCSPHTAPPAALAPQSIQLQLGQMQPGHMQPGLSPPGHGQQGWPQPGWLPAQPPLAHLQPTKPQPMQHGGFGALPPAPCTSATHVVK